MYLGNNTITSIPLVIIPLLNDSLYKYAATHDLYNLVETRDLLLQVDEKCIVRDKSGRLKLGILEVYNIPLYHGDHSLILRKMCL